MAAMLAATLLVSLALDGGRESPGGMDERLQDALVLAGFSVPALAAIWFVVGWSLRPLARAARAAAEIGPGQSAARLPEAGVPEDVLPLVRAVNGALDRMAAAYESERRFTGNAAHALRTPLAVLSLRLQAARLGTQQADWPAIEADLAAVTRLVAQMLDLARKEAGGAPPAEGVNPGRLAREAAAGVLPLAEAAGRALVVEAPALPMLRAAEADLRDALSALLENALMHGAGAVRLTVASRDGGVCFTVTDAGAGPDAALRPGLFERFAKRGDSPGSGLGLAIVREVARAHGGRAYFEPGDCCAVSLWLPG